jgi:hypothetical protein
VSESQQEYCERLRYLDDFYQTDKNSPLHHNKRCPIHDKRFIVKESYGYGYSRGIRINETSAPRELAYSTVTGYIRELKQWASGHADHITDVDSAGWRMITAHHWINGFENIRVLHIQKSTAYNRIQAGLE